MLPLLLLLLPGEGQNTQLSTTFWVTKDYFGDSSASAATVAAAAAR
jgi:hypothetical protein